MVCSSTVGSPQVSRIAGVVGTVARLAAAATSRVGGGGGHTVAGAATRDGDVG